jgi:hypothetical protein
MAILAKSIKFFFTQFLTGAMGWPPMTAFCCNNQLLTLKGFLMTNTPEGRSS